MEQRDVYVMCTINTAQNRLNSRLLRLWVDFRQKKTHVWRTVLKIGNLPPTPVALRFWQHFRQVNKPADIYRTLVHLS